MRVFVTGATGMIGRVLAVRLVREGHALVAVARDAARAGALLGPGVALCAADASDAELEAHLARADAIVNLAGESIGDGRWSRARQEVLRASRIGLTERLVRALARAAPHPEVLVSASAVGFYGVHAASEALDEESPPGEDFLATMCRDWEQAARAAEAYGVRVARVRIGVVLAREGGALAKMLPLFRAGLGGKLGSGAQVLSWIDRDDVVEAIVRALSDARYAGALNLTAPEPVSNAEFTRALARALGKRAWLPVPALALRAALGRAATIALDGQRVLPRALERLGHRFLYPELASALATLL